MTIKPSICIIYSCIVSLTVSIHAKSIINEPFTFKSSKSSITWEQLEPIKSQFKYMKGDKVNATAIAHIKYSKRFRSFKYMYSITNTTSPNKQITHIGIEKKAKSISVKGPFSFQEIKKNSWNSHLWKALPTLNPKTTTKSIIINDNLIAIPITSFGIKPNETIEDFSITSQFLPDIQKVYIRGFSWLFSIPNSTLITSPINDVVFGYTIGPVDNYEGLSQEAYLTQLIDSYNKMILLLWIYDAESVEKIELLFTILQSETLKTQQKVKGIYATINMLETKYKFGKIEQEAYLLLKNRINYYLNHYL